MVGMRMDETEVDNDDYDDDKVEGGDEGDGDLCIVWNAVGFVSCINDVRD